LPHGNDPKSIDTYRISPDVLAMGPVRRTVNLVCAVALTGVGGYWLFDIIFHMIFEDGTIASGESRAFNITVLAAAMMTILGAYWMWVDFLSPSRGKRD
jgi:hypothetical protein